MWSAATILDFLGGAWKVTDFWISSRRLEFTSGGRGPYVPACHYNTPGLPHHTIFLPVSLAEGDRLPLLIWANGFGLAWGLAFGHFLREIASHGYIVIANGAPRGMGTTDEKGQISAVEWAKQPSDGPSDVREHMDTSRIALAGQSKGGVHTYAAADILRGEPGLRTIALFNVGLMCPRSRDLQMLRRITRPVYYFFGDERDVLYKNAQRDWELIPETLPAYFASFNVGHMGTFYDESGGLFSQAALE
jgi:hypothetical protein